MGSAFCRQISIVVTSHYNEGGGLRPPSVITKRSYNLDINRIQIRSGKPKKDLGRERSLDETDLKKHRNFIHRRISEITDLYLKQLSNLVIFFSTGRFKASNQKEKFNVSETVSRKQKTDDTYQQRERKYRESQ